MSASFSTKELIEAVSRIAASAQTFASELNEADARLGDGDLGITVSNGWRASHEKLQAERPDDLGTVFLLCAKAFQETSASSFGTLTATGLIAAAKATMGQTNVPVSEIQHLVRAAADAMAKRGKAQLGDKTALDSLDAAAAAAVDCETLSQLKDACAKGVAAAAEEFRNRPNKVGRARMFGDGSLGITDPGMLAIQRIAESI